MAPVVFKRAWFVRAALPMKPGCLRTRSERRVVYRRLIHGLMFGAPHDIGVHTDQV